MSSQKSVGYESSHKPISLLSLRWNYIQIMGNDKQNVFLIYKLKLTGA